MPETVDKGIAAEVFAEANGLEQDQVLKIGNAFHILGNDYPMVSKPGGVGVDSPLTTLWILELMLQRAPLNPALVDPSQVSGERSEWVKGGIDLKGIQTRMGLRKARHGFSFRPEQAMLDKPLDVSGFEPVILDITRFSGAVSKLLR